MPKAKGEFLTDLIRNLENRYLEENPVREGSKIGKIRVLGGVSYVAIIPSEVKKIAKILTSIIYDEANTEKLSRYRSNEAGRDLIQQELFPAQKLFPGEHINKQRKKVADELGKIALGLMMTPESAMEPAGAAAATPSSGRS